MLFLIGEIESIPNGDTIYKIQNNWSFYELENNHGYIQWLFPLETRGLNEHSQPLRKDEIKVIKYFFFSIVT